MNLLIEASLLLQCTLLLLWATAMSTSASSFSAAHQHHPVMMTMAFVPSLSGDEVFPAFSKPLNMTKKPAIVGNLCNDYRPQVQKRLVKNNVNEVKYADRLTTRQQHTWATRESVSMTDWTLVSDETHGTQRQRPTCALSTPPSYWNGRPVKRPAFGLECP